MKMEDRPSTNILQLFDQNEYLKIAAPMVRYSKVQFRTLMREWGADLCYTPMILADSFCQSDKARQNEFVTNLVDTPLITQFAANTIHDFVGASYMVSPYCDGVGLNCGCPQRWAKQQGLGCVMLENPEIINDIVKQCRNTIAKPFTVSVKMRILKDLRKTVELCRQFEMAGASFLSVHARTPSQLTGEINKEALTLIVENVNCPIVANGGVKSLKDCEKLQEETKCNGIMVANAILENPTLFSGSNETTMKCVQDWLDICYNSTILPSDYVAIKNCASSPLINNKPPNLTFQCFHHHLNFDDVLQFFESEFKITPKLYPYEKYFKYCVQHPNYENRCSIYLRLKKQYDVQDSEIGDSYNYDNSDGTFFTNKIEGEEGSDCFLSNMFLETG